MKKELSFEEALKELEEIVVNLEKGDISLDDAIKAYEKGSILKNQCEKRLNEAKNLGFENAFIFASENGVRITIEEALNK